MAKLKPILVTGVGIVVLILIVVVVATGAPKRSRGTGKPLTASQDSNTQEHFSKPRVTTAAIYEQDGVTFEHFWPLDSAAQHLKTDESEIVVHNRGSQTVEFSSVGMDYFVGGSQMPHYSGTWEKFPDDVSWKKIEYINISPVQYKGEKLALQPGQKSKIHYHYQVQQGQSQNPDQKVKLNIAFTVAGSPKRLDQELVRKQPPRQALESEAGHDVSTGQDSQGH